MSNETKVSAEERKEVALQAAISAGAANGAYSKAWRLYVSHIPQMTVDYTTARGKNVKVPSDRFWQIMPFFTKEVFQRVFYYGDKRNGVNSAAWEFFRVPLTYKNCIGRHEEPYTMDEAMSFAATFSVVSSVLYRPMFDVVKDRGDDSYGDLLDSLAHGGKTVFHACLSGKYKNNKDIEEALTEVFQTTTIMEDTDKVVPPAKFVKWVMHGENYNDMMLRDAAKKCFAHLAFDVARQKDQESGEDIEYDYAVD